MPYLGRHVEGGQKVRAGQKKGSDLPLLFLLQSQSATRSEEFECFLELLNTEDSKDKICISFCSVELASLSLKVSNVVFVLLLGCMLELSVDLLGEMYSFFSCSISEVDILLWNITLAK